MKSILQDDEKICFLCGAHEYQNYQDMHWHHIFGGPNRRHSEKYGLKVRLCSYRCHEYGPNAVHRNKAVDLALKAKGQRAFEEHQYKDFHGSREKFMEIFGRNWL